MLRMVLHKPKVVFVAQVDLGGQQPIYPQMELAFKNISIGSVAALRGGMTLLLGTAPGKDDFGRLRYKHQTQHAPAISMTVSRFSEGTNDGEGVIVENSYITVLEEFRVWAKVPRMIGQVIRKDGEWQGIPNAAHPPPVANAGPGTAGTIAANGKLAVTFDGTNSFKFAPEASGYVLGMNQFLWDVGAGTIVSGTTTTPTLTVEFPPGWHYVYLTVWGEEYPSGNENTHTCSVPIFARDPANDLSIAAFHVTNHMQTLVGQEVTVDFFTPLPRSEFPDSGLMMMWDDEYEYGPTDRVHMEFIGWHQRDEANISGQETATLHSTHLTFLDVGRRLEMLPGFPLALEYNANPGPWSQTRYPTLFYYFWFILFWHSTALEVADLLLDSDTLKLLEFVALGSDRANLHEQVNSIAAKAGPDHRMTCSRQGQLRLVVDPMIQNVAERTIFVQDTFTDDEWTDVSYSYVRPPKVNQIRTMALVSRHTYILVNGKNTIEVIACVAPGEAHGQGEQSLEINERLVVNQYQLNIQEGNRYARMNARYGRFTITVPHERVVRSFEIAYHNWVRLTITGADHPERELPTSFTDQRGIVHEMTIQYDYTDTGLLRTCTFQWEMETSGQPAQTVILWPDAPDPAVMAARVIEGEAEHA